uniref:Uncharacterized protein n=1 Tax=Trypanosoma congolense (strain IL3000) TaxID=1068625 RepID=G0UW70_TRYCI|nr:conserved hypothetical protein [Trypanosoma congolense IL3000]
MAGNSGDMDAAMSTFDRGGVLEQGTLNSTCSYIKHNRELHFEKPDDSLLNIPLGTNNIVHFVATDYKRFPHGCYRTVDYFRAAAEAFLKQLRSEYARQCSRPQEGGSTNKRFTWSNKGPMAVCFAASCDMLKLLYEFILVGNERPEWDTIVDHFILFLISESQLPQNGVTETTYYTKYMDWCKGGTRYQNSNFKSNIRFPSAAQRRLAVEGYLRSGLWDTVAPQAVVLVARKAHTDKGNAADIVPTSETSTSGPPGSGPCVEDSAPYVDIVKRQNQQGSTKNVAAFANAVQLREMELSRFRWRIGLQKIVGGLSTSELPDERSKKVLSFVRLCEMSWNYDQLDIIMNIIVGSSENIQILFERYGGIVALRRLIGKIRQAEGAPSLLSFMLSLLNMKLKSWSAGSRQSWLHDDQGRNRGNLKWLRALDIIPSSKQVVWLELVTKLERKYVLPETKREVRQLTSGGVVSEACGESKSPLVGGEKSGESAPPPSKAHGTHFNDLPDAPWFSGRAEDRAIFLAQKLQYCNGRQSVWREAILKAIGGDRVDVLVPCWYNHYELLCVDPPS